MKRFFVFGETVDGYDFKVINEREARASAGLMFLFGVTSLYSVFLSHTLFWAEAFSITFIVEFFIRTVINPRYAPYMVLASFIVVNQSPEWVAAKPKQFAWILGAFLGLAMTVFIVSDIMSPLRLLTCLLCLVLLFFESAFGICLGCLVYKRFNIAVEKCPGDICETPRRLENKREKFTVITLFVILVFVTYFGLKEYKYSDRPTAPVAQTHPKQAEPKTPQASKPTQKCQPPQWAISMGHEAMWKKHHGCE